MFVVRRMLGSNPYHVAHEKEQLHILCWVQAYWRLHRQTWTNFAIFMSLQISLGAWQCYEYSTSASDEAAFGWGVALAKGCAGALYPAFFGIVISMSRWTATFVRGNSVLADLINWDEFRTFHVTMAVNAFILSTFHAIGHIAGSFVHASERKNQAAVTLRLGEKFESVDYATFVKSTPGWTGITAFSIFSWICVASSPLIRRFEIFQASHILIYPLIGMLMAHGSSHFLQYPIFGFVLMGPTLLICLERSSRVLKSWTRYLAQVQPIDKGVIMITLPGKSLKCPKPGQYCLIRLASLSIFEWHPFSISSITETGEVFLFAKQSGDWTDALARLATEEMELSFNVDGPFGAPAQQFHQYDHVMFFATGIGVTPCASIINSFMHKGHIWEPWSCHPAEDDHEQDLICHRYPRLPQYFHVYWSTRSSGISIILWFVEMVRRSQESTQDNPRLRVTLNVTDIRTGDECPQLTSAISDTTVLAQKGILVWQFGRLDLTQSMSDHYKVMTCGQEDLFKQSSRKRIGVFFCGAKAVKSQLARLCMRNTIRGISSGCNIEYHFRPEVF